MIVVRSLPLGPVAPKAAIRVGIADPALASAVAQAINGALAAIELPEISYPTVRVRSRKRLVAVAAELAGAIAIVRVTDRNGRHLVTLIDGIRAAGAAGIQFVWDGVSGERHVFAALERARSNPAAAPVVVTTETEPVAALRLLIAHRVRRSP